MKTKTWILLLSGLALLLAVICLWQFFGQPSAGTAEILLDGKLIRTVDLSEDQQFTVEGPDGYNVISVQNGKISVIEADCKGNDCVQTGPRSGGIPIICLPHRLVIRFTNSNGLDGMSG